MRWPTPLVSLASSQRTGRTVGIEVHMSRVALLCLQEGTEECHIRVGLVEERRLLMVSAQQEGGCPEGARAQFHSWRSNRRTKGRGLAAVFRAACRSPYGPESFLLSIYPSMFLPLGRQDSLFIAVSPQQV